MYVGFISIIILIALIKLLDQIHKPLVCAAIYVAIQIFFNLLFGSSLLAILIPAAIDFGFFYGWFWLLDRYEGAVWVLVLVGGLAFPTILRLLILAIC